MSVPDAKRFLRRPSAAAPAAEDTEKSKSSFFSPPPRFFFPAAPPPSPSTSPAPTSTRPSVAPFATEPMASGSHSFVAAPYTRTVTNRELGLRGNENTSGTQTLSASTSSCTSVRFTSRSELSATVARKLV